MVASLSPMLMAVLSFPMAAVEVSWVRTWLDILSVDFIIEVEFIASKLKLLLLLMTVTEINTE